jgi:hypothetical protein
MVGQALAGKLSELGHDVTRLKTGCFAPRGLERAQLHAELMLTGR